MKNFIKNLFNKMNVFHFCNHDWEIIKSENIYSPINFLENLNEPPLFTITTTYFGNKRENKKEIKNSKKNTNIIGYYEVQRCKKCKKIKTFKEYF